MSSEVLGIAPYGGRGLKRLKRLRGISVGGYRPLRGAWIETYHGGVVLALLVYRPLRGAWIETPIPAPPPHISPYRPLRGAWIET